MNELLRLRLAQNRTLKIKVLSKSAKTEIVGELADGTLKIKVAAAPEKGKANAALCAFLARETGGTAEVISGHTAPLKLVRVTPA